MTQAPFNLVEAISNELAALQAKRDALAGEISEINRKIANIARQLGIEPPEQPMSTLSRLAPPPPVDQRHIGSVPEAMMQVLREADRGYTRPELKKILRDGPAGESVRKNENTYYNAVKRYLTAGKIVEIGGYIYHPDRAPLENGESDPRGTHLPANVTLFEAPLRKADHAD